MWEVSSDPNKPFPLTPAMLLTLKDQETLHPWIVLMRKISKLMGGDVTGVFNTWPTNSGPDGLPPT